MLRRSVAVPKLYRMKSDIASVAFVPAIGNHRQTACMKTTASPHVQCKTFTWYFRLAESKYARFSSICTIKFAFSARLRVNAPAPFPRVFFTTSRTSPNSSRRFLASWPSCRRLCTERSRFSMEACTCDKYLI